MAKQAVPRSRTRNVTRSSSVTVRRASRCAEGSSSNRILASCANARAKETSFCSPPESSATSRWARCSMPHAPSASATAASSPGVGRCQLPWCGLRPIITTWSTRKPVATSSPCATTAICDATSRRESSAISRPKRRAFPWRGARTPESTRRQRRFPGAVGPHQDHHLALPEGQRNFSDYIFDFLAPARPISRRHPFERERRPARLTHDRAAA